MFFQYLYYDISLNILFTLNSTVFMLAVIAILNRLYQTIRTSKNTINKTMSSFFALVITTIVILSFTLILIGSSDIVKSQLGFFVWLIYISAILIIFTVVEALFSFENVQQNSEGRKSLLHKFGVSIVLTSLFYDFCYMYLTYDLYVLLDSLGSLNTTLNLKPHHQDLGWTNTFTELRFGTSSTPKLYTLSGLLQGLCLIIVVKILRVKPE